jgi:hypothetical protein
MQKVDDAQDTSRRALAGEIAPPGAQEVPLNTTGVSELSSIPRQNDVVGHVSTPSSLPESPVGVGAVHVLPLKVSAFPVESTAAQKLGKGHDTPIFSVMAPPANAWLKDAATPGSMVTGLVHALPLNVIAVPASLTATQKVGDAHDTSQPTPPAPFNGGAPVEPCFQVPPVSV